MKLLNRLVPITLISIAILCIAMKEKEEEQQAPAGSTINWGVFERQGIRPTMEDAFVHDTLTLAPCAQEAHYFGLFDGHGLNGAPPADYAAAHAIDYFATAYQEDLAIENAFTKSYLRLDAEIQAAYPQAGTTALSALILGDELYLAWAGDSRAVVANAQGEIKARTIDHKPNIFEEKSRIIKAGEKITEHVSLQVGPYSRVGGLAISRTLGDKATKDLVKPDAIIAQPEILRVCIQRGDFIILACDGLWDVSQNEDVVEYVVKYHLMRLGYLQSTFGDLERIPEREKTTNDGNDERLRLIATGLANQAYNKRSTDNISVMLIHIQ